MSQGAGVAPAWANAGTGLSLNGISWSTQPSQTFAVGTSGTNFNISSTGSVHTFNIPNASLVNRGLVSTGTQAFVGDKTFNGQVAVTNCGTSTNIYCNNGNSFGTLATLGTLDANDQRFVTNGTERMRILSTGNIGIGTITPSNALHISSSTGAVSGLRLGVTSGTATTTANGKALSVNSNGDVVVVDSVGSISNALTIATTTNNFVLTSTVNGIAASTTTNFVNSNTLTSVANVLTNSTNGVSATTTIINTNVVSTTTF
jgi:hypothetical protein